MPSPMHQILAQFFGSWPTIVAQQAAAELGPGVVLPPRVETVGGELAQISAPQHRADAVVLLGEPGQANRLAIVVEVQLAIDPEKHFTWPVYVAGIRARERCPTLLPVATPYHKVENWARAPIPLGPNGDLTRPLVFGPGVAPLITDVVAAKQNLALALFSAIAHAKTPEGLPVAVATLLAARDLDLEPVGLYDDVVRRAWGSKIHLVMEALMESHYEYQSEFARKYVAQGKAQGRAEGKAEGKAEGEAKGKADALLAVMAARKLDVSEAQRQAVLSCRDLVQLDRWIARAATASTVEEALR